MSVNPLLKPFDTPFGIHPFEKITTENIREAYIKGMEEQKEIIDKILKSGEPTFENTIVALDGSHQTIDRAKLLLEALSDSNSTEEIRALERDLSPIYSEHKDDIFLNAELFDRIKTVYDNRQKFNLDYEQNTLLDLTYKDFASCGATLSQDKKDELRKINAEISILMLTFNQYNNLETNNTYITVDTVEELAGLPQDSITAAAAMAENNGAKGKYMFNMQRASCMPVLLYASNRDLRKKVYFAYYNRGNQGNAQDTKEICKKLVTLRLQKAKLLGFEHYAAFELNTRMASTAESVYSLLDQIWTPAIAKVKEELDDIRAEIKKEGKDFEPDKWDFMYYQEKAKQAKYSVDENELRPYLSLDNVKKGVFYVANKLHGITMKPRDDLPKYDKSIDSYEVVGKDGKTIAIFYSDYLVREGKTAGAWCLDFRPQTYKDGVRVIPVVENVCNFSQPTEGPTLLTMDEASTAFHEFGHAMHSFMHDVHYSHVCDPEWDFIELPSQLNEHWAFEPEVLNVYAKHYKTGEVIPIDLVKKIEESSKYGAGFAIVEYLAASYVDMDLHTLTEIPEDFDIMKFEEDKMRARGIPEQILPRYRVTNFSHIMGSSYTAGYYSYKWAEVLDCDVFHEFKKSGDIFNQELAKKYRECILSQGGKMDGMTMIKNFLGREPETEPLLEHYGLK